MIRIIKQGIAAARPGQMYGWPGITRASNGDIIVAASERKFHCCPYGREVIIRSKDNGETWSLPMEVYNSEMDDRDANLLTLKDGTLVLSWFTSNAFETCGWTERASRATDKMREELLGTWMLRSHDNGVTWEEKPSRIPVGMHISPVELSDGSLISIGWDFRFSNDPTNKNLCAYKSFDQGKNWKKSCDIECGRRTDVNEPELNENHVLDTGSGNLVALFRKCGDYLRQAFSADYGKTWTKPEATKIWGFPAQMTKLSNGSILCVYGHRRTPYSIRGVLSRDNGKTWDTDNIFTIYEWADEPDMGYPSSLEVAPGEILTVFYCSRRDTLKNNHRTHIGRQKQSEGSSPEGILFVRYKITG
jgi:hypothetical protein